jgi:oligosaccharide repeat unit polymerase
MSAISIICGLGMAAIVLSCLRRDADLFSPFRIFGFIWFFAIGLTDMKFSRLQNEWSLLSWFVLLLGVSSFMLGNFIVFAITSAKKKYTVLEMRRVVQNTKVNERKLFFVVILLVSLYCISLTIETLMIGGLPIFSAFPDRARMDFGIFGIHLIVTAVSVILVLITEYFLLIKGFAAKKFLLTLLFIVVAGSYLTLLVRLNYIVFLIIGGAIAYYTSSFLRTRNILIVLAIIVALFAFLIQMREARYAENFVYVISDMKFSRAYASLAGPYMYIVMNLENFARLVNQLDFFTYGYYSFDFLFAVSGLKHWLADYFGLVERMYQIGSFNTFPFLLPYYRDFGLLGVAFFPLVLGIVIGSIYHWMIATAQLLAIAVYSYCVFVMLISFFTNPLTMLGFVFELAVLIGAHMYIADVHRPTAGAE